MGSAGLVLGFSEYREPAQRLAKAMGLPYAEVEIHRFPDGETSLRLPLEMPPRIILCRSLDYPNEKLVELLLAAAGARQQGVEQLTLVVPYLCYMRQDKAFHPGEVVSQGIIGKLLEQYVDALITVDSHLHRVHNLSEVVPVEPAINLYATGPMAKFLSRRVEAPFIIGPDEESGQWVAAIAAQEQLDHRVASKQRMGDADVKVTLPTGEYTGRNIVLVDDIASTGCTLEAAAIELVRHKPASISVLVTHAFFTGDAMARLQVAGVENIWSCDSIPHTSNAVFLAQLLADAAKL